MKEHANRLLSPEVLSRIMTELENEALNSPCTKLKVGAGIYDIHSYSRPTNLIKAHNKPVLSFKHVCTTDSCKDIVHAEAEALLTYLRYFNKDKYHVLYITHEPCYYCSKLIVLSEINYIVYKHAHEGRSGHGSGVDLLRSSNKKVVHYQEETI